MPAERRLYVGPSLRRLRRDLGLTQADMAADLEVSASYVALLERNHRPLSAEMLLRRAQTYKLDMAALAADTGASDAARLQTVLKDPMFADIDLPALDAGDVTTNFPGITEALLRLYTAYREEQLALADRGVGGDAPGVGSADSADPVAESRRFLEARRNSFPTLDDAAERLAQAVAQHDGMVPYFKARHSLRVRRLPSEVMVGSTRRLDHHRREVLLSDDLDTASQAFQLALQLAYLELGADIDAVIGDGAFATESGQRLTRRALASYAAAAVLMPYSAFARAAESRRYDLGPWAASSAPASSRWPTGSRPCRSPARSGFRSSSSAWTRPATSPSASTAPASPSRATAAAARYGTCTRRSARPARSSPNGSSCPTASGSSPSPARSPPGAAASASCGWSARSPWAAPPSTRTG